MASSAKDIQLRELKDTVSQLKTMVEYSTHLVRSFRGFGAGHPEIRCSDSGCQCSPL